MSKLSEEEIKDIIEELLSDPLIYFSQDSSFESIQIRANAIQGLLDLYQKEKEKNLIFKGATIVSDLKNDGIEMKMNADKLIALYLEEKEKNKELYEDNQKHLAERYRLTFQKYREVNDELEIDIENKYVNKVVFTLEESIYILNKKYFCDEVEDMALDRLIKYIKEESIPRAVVEEAKAYIEYYAMNNFALTDFNLREKAFRHILELLNKGE